MSFVVLATTVDLCAFIRNEIARKIPLSLSTLSPNVKVLSKYSKTHNEEININKFTTLFRFYKFYSEYMCIWL